MNWQRTRAMRQPASERTSSSRFDGNVPKQYLELAGRLVVEHSVDRLAASDAVGEVVVVVAADRLDGEQADRLRSHPDVTAVVAGGATRADSVACGLAAVPEEREFVLVHDAARPQASDGLIARVVDATCAQPLLAQAIIAALLSLDPAAQRAKRQLAGVVHGYIDAAIGRGPSEAQYRVLANVLFSVQIGLSHGEVDREEAIATLRCAADACFP